MSDLMHDERHALWQEIDRLRAEVAALKANDPLAEMWRELAEYQPFADRDGHGDTWRAMCAERTVHSAYEARAAACRAAQSTAAGDMKWAARCAADGASHHAAHAMMDARRGEELAASSAAESSARLDALTNINRKSAIAAIRRAKEGR